MSKMSTFELELKNIIESYKKDHHPISLAVSDIATRYGVSVHYVYNYIDMYLREEDDTHMSFAGNKAISSSYVEKRFKGEV